MDALSEVLATLHLTSALYCRSELSAPWGLSFPPRPVATFHAVRRGVCWLRHEGTKEAIALSAGDFVVFPGGLAHAFSDHPRGKAEPIEEVLKRQCARCGVPLVYGGGGAPTTLLCGHFEFARNAVHPLLSMLPPVMHLRGEDGRASPQLEATLELLARESAVTRPGTSAVIARAADILFVQLIRTYLEAESCEGWLRGLRDPTISLALAAIHQAPERDWTLDELAKAAGLSRSAFCARFNELVGEPPYRYLTRWRIHRASELLQGGGLGLKQIAERVGFGDEAAFSKAFKRHVGMAPAAWRRASAGTAAMVG